MDAEPMVAVRPRGRILIPRVIHQIWPGDDPMPDELAQLGRSWARHHPGWEMRLWRPSDLPPLRNQELFDTATTYALRSDIARYELLLRHGGVYVDTDFECLRPLDELLYEVEAFIGTEDGHHLTNALMGAIPGHPLIDAIVAAIPRSAAEHPGATPELTTGPHLVTAIVDGDPELRARLTVFEPELFYPYLFNEKYRRDEEFPRSYAVHHWAGGWLPAPATQVGPRYRIVVVPDWDRPAHVTAVVRPFAELFGPGDPIELVLACPRQPGARDLERAQRLFAELAIDPVRCAAITLESFEETATAAYDVAVVPAGDAGDLLLDVGAAVGWLHAARPRIDTHGRPALARVRGEAALAGDPEALRARLAAFPPAKPATQPAAKPAAPPATKPAQHAALPAGGHRATYLGNDRLLVSTTWGGKLFMSATDLSLTPEVLHDGNYDDPFTHFLQRTLRPGDVAFDIGANVGLFTILMARLVGAAGNVVAYEAAPANVVLLRDNVAINYYGDWVDVVAKAAAATAGMLRFHECARFQGNGSLLPHDEAYRAGFPTDVERVVEVAAEPLDVHAGRFPAIALVKIDVEGGEEQVLAGMETLVSCGTVQRICLELLRERMGEDWGPITQRLRTLGAAGWTLATIGGGGETVPVSVDRVIEHGMFSQVLLERPGLAGSR